MTDDDTNDRMRWIRLRKRLDELAPVVVVGLLVVGALGGWLAYQTHAEPTIETEERTVGTWNEQGELSHGAEVTAPNPLYQQGQELSNRPVYFTRLSPEFGASYAYTYDASATGTLDVTVNASLRIQSVDSDGEAYWTSTEPLAGTHTREVSPGETVTLETDFNVSAVLAEIDQIQSGIGSSAGTSEAEVVFDTQVAGTVNQENVANTHQRSMVVEPGDSTYSVETDDSFQTSHESVEVVQTERSYGPLRSYGPFVLIVLSLLGLVGLAGASYRGWIPPSAGERLALEHHQERTEFDDWISTGSIPAWERTGTEVELDSLEDLVDLAIDTNERVIEDTDSGDFFVPGGNRYYTYSADPVGDGDDPGDAPDDLTIADRPRTDDEGPALFQELEQSHAHDGGGADGPADTNGDQVTDGGERDPGTDGSDDTSADASDDDSPGGSDPDD
jgi:hypothetical protein